MLCHLGESIDIALEPLAHQELLVKDVIHKPSGRVIQHRCTLIHVHAAGFTFESPLDLMPTPKTPSLATSLPLTHQELM
jgi:hypothetical protein